MSWGASVEVGWGKRNKFKIPDGAEEDIVVTPASKQFASSKKIPKGTIGILLTIRTAAVSITFDGVTTPTGSVGHNYGITSIEPTYIPLSYDQLLKVQMYSATGLVHVAYVTNMS